MRRRRDGRAASRAFSAVALALSIAAVTSGCGGGERAERERQVAALRAQIDELRKAQEANAKDLSRLAGEMKALDAQSAFLVGETLMRAPDPGAALAQLLT